MARYLMEVTETVKKTIMVEAVTIEEAKHEAAMENLRMDFNDYSLEIKVLDVVEENE